MKSRTPVSRTQHFPPRPLLRRAAIGALAGGIFLGAAAGTFAQAPGQPQAPQADQRGSRGGAIGIISVEASAWSAG